MEPLIASGGWCAPSDRIYDTMQTPPEPLVAYCPDWDDPIGEETCVSHSVWTGETTPKGWHDCVDEYDGPHRVCKCADCGAERVIVEENRP